MKKILPLTYEPKIEGVINGTIRQTIRKGWKYKVGDQIAFHGWEGKPYRSKWSFRTGYYELTQVIDCTIYPHGFRVTHFHHWTDWDVDAIARWDGIDPPTGVELGRVLNELNKIPQAGIYAQILRW